MNNLALGTLAVVALLVVAGVAVAAPGAAAPADRSMDGTNSPWLSDDDDRLDRFQERFQLTDREMAQLRDRVQALHADGADPAEIRAVVTEMLRSFGVDDPQLGPQGDHRRGGIGPHRGGHGGNGDMLRDGSGAGTGPHGANGDCQSA